MRKWTKVAACLVVAVSTACSEERPDERGEPSAAAVSRTVDPEAEAMRKRIDRRRSAMLKRARSVPEGPDGHGRTAGYSSGVSEPSGESHKLAPRTRSGPAPESGQR